MIQYEVNGGGRISIKEDVRLGDNLIDFEYDFEYIAVRCAEDYHSAHDGWQTSWPVNMVIYEHSDNDDGKELWRGHVDRENCPVFSAYSDVRTV